MKILLTNDDGIQSKGIIKLAENLSKTEEIHIVAPHKKLQGISCSVTFDMPVKVEKYPLNLGETASYRVYGTPADCIIMGLDLLARETGLVISGVNDELNIGDDTRFSGTIGACIEAAYSGVKAFSLSMDKYRNLDTAVKFSKFMVNFLKENKMGKGVFLNINLPDAPLAKIKGVKFRELGRRIYLDRVHKIKEEQDKAYYRIGSKKIADQKNDAYEAIKNNYIAITPMSVDLTAYSKLEEIKKNWKLYFP